MRIDAFAVQMQAARRPQPRDDHGDERRGRRGGSPDEDDAPTEAQGPGGECEERRRPFVTPTWHTLAARHPVEERQSFSDALLAKVHPPAPSAATATATATATDDRCGRAAGPAVPAADLVPFHPPPTARGPLGAAASRTSPYRRDPVATTASAFDIQV